MLKVYIRQLHKHPTPDTQAMTAYQINVTDKKGHGKEILWIKNCLDEVGQGEVNYKPKVSSV